MWVYQLEFCEPENLSSISRNRGSKKLNYLWILIIFSARCNRKIHGASVQEKLLLWRVRKEMVFIKIVQNSLFMYILNVCFQQYYSLITLFCGWNFTIKRHLISWLKFDGWRLVSINFVIEWNLTFNYLIDKIAMSYAWASASQFKPVHEGTDQECGQDDECDWVVEGLVCHLNCGRKALPWPLPHWLDVVGEEQISNILLLEDQLGKSISPAV